MAERRAELFSGLGLDPARAACFQKGSLIDPEKSREVYSLSQNNAMSDRLSGLGVRSLEVPASESQSYRVVYESGEAKDYRTARRMVAEFDRKQMTNELVDQIHGTREEEGTTSMAALSIRGIHNNLSTSSIDNLNVGIRLTKPSYERVDVTVTNGEGNVSLRLVKQNFWEVPFTNEDGNKTWKRVDEKGALEYITHQLGIEHEEIIAA